MSSDSPPTYEVWHTALAEKDSAIRSMADAGSAQAENVGLHRRLDVLVAELRINRSAVGVRDAMIAERDALLREQDALLREQDAALRERDTDLATAKSSLETIQATRTWRLTRRAARVLGALRRLVRR